MSMITLARRGWQSLRDPRLRHWRKKQRQAAPARYYGDGGTIHASGTLDVVLANGVVTEVWFRCQELPFQVSTGNGHRIYGANRSGVRITGIELLDRDDPTP